MIATKPRKPRARPSIEPQEIDEQNWYYEESDGLHVIHQVYVDGKYLRTDHIVIPNKMLAASVQRMGLAGK